MFRMMLVPDKERFVKLIQHSCGDVMLHLPDGSKCSLKKESTALQMIQLLDMGSEGIALSLSCPDDFPHFVQFMMEAGISQ